MKIVLTIDVDDQPTQRLKEAVIHTIAVDVAYMLNEKHEDVYRTTTLFTEEEILGL